MCVGGKEWGGKHPLILTCRTHIQLSSDMEKSGVVICFVDFYKEQGGEINKCLICKKNGKYMLGGVVVDGDGGGVVWTMAA